MDHLRISSALERIMDVVGKANKYIDEVSPWDLAKKDPSRPGTTSITCVSVSGSPPPF